MTVTWPDDIDSIFAGDLTAALGYRTPAGGVVVQAVAPIGLRNRERGTLGFTTSLGFSKKLERIAADARIAMAFHAREYGRARGTPRSRDAIPVGPGARARHRGAVGGGSSACADERQPPSRTTKGGRLLEPVASRVLREPGAGRGGRHAHPRVANA
jgi:hypothetical protein